jgi:hypothetical protein
MRLNLVLLISLWTKAVKNFCSSFFLMWQTAVHS